MCILIRIFRFAQEVVSDVRFFAVVYFSAVLKGSAAVSDLINLQKWRCANECNSAFGNQNIRFSVFKKNPHSALRIPQLKKDYF